LIEKDMTLANLHFKPHFTIREGIRLAHVDANWGATPEVPPLLFVNGWTGDHRIFTLQISHFCQYRRVVAIDLRGHGRSDAPEQEYTMAQFADDIAWQCAELELEKPLIIGHSFGGAVTLELCGRYPDLACGMIMIDTIIMPPAALKDAPEFKRFLEAIGGPNYLAALRANAWEIGCDYDDPSRRKSIYENYILPPCEKIPQHAAYSALANYVHNYDPVPAARSCRIPMAYISADVPDVNRARDLDMLKSICPQLMTAKTLLAGHFNTIEVADQINAMIQRFIDVGLSAKTA
jgi:pimeloyl-ACP methyl ester carboxylesterase